LGTWGYKIIQRIGKELTKVTPSRGFVMELSGGLTVILASRVGIPISTTHCQIGGVVGCGLVDGKKNIDWNCFFKIIFSWFITLPASALISAALFSFGHYSP
jgi:solute carrier family 20 (sodium-dependent phosphate transporter)